MQGKIMVRVESEKKKLVENLKVSHSNEYKNSLITQVCTLGHYCWYCNLV